MEHKSGYISLGVAIKQFLSQYKHNSKLLESKVVNAWPKVMGQTVAAYTIEVFIIEGKLFVKLKSSALRGELMMHRSRIIKALNEYVGAEVVREIVLQ